VQDVAAGESELFNLTGVLKLHPKLLGPRLGGKVQTLLAAARNGQWEQHGESVEVAGELLSPAEYTLTYETTNTEVAKLRDGMFAHLDTAVTAAQELEGLYRDALHEMQTLRKDSGFKVGELRGHAVVFGNAQVAAMFSQYEQQLKAQGNFEKVAYLETKELKVQLAD
jgi:isoleucyl-tRNA synthetase